MADGGSGKAAMALVRTTFASEDDAKACARRLVEAGPACCVHILPMTSMYSWKGDLQEETEWLLEARVPAAAAEAVCASVEAAHPYEVPLVELVDVRVNAAYADWARDVTA